MTLFFIGLTTWLALNKQKCEDEMVHISTTTAKPFTPMCSPRGRDYQKKLTLSFSYFSNWYNYMSQLTIEQCGQGTTRNRGRTPVNQSSSSSAIWSTTLLSSPALILSLVSSVRAWWGVLCAPRWLVVGAPRGLLPWRRCFLSFSYSFSTYTSIATQHGHSLTHSLSPSLTHSLPHSLTHNHSHAHTHTITLTHTHTHILTHTQSHLHTQSHTHTHTHTHTHSHTHSHQCMAPEFCESLTKKSL